MRNLLQIPLTGLLGLCSATLLAGSADRGLAASALPASTSLAHSSSAAALVTTSPTVTPSGEATARTTPAVSPSQAVALGVNRLTAVDGEIHLNHPGHRVEFGSEGIRFEPGRGPVWSWRLVSVILGEESPAELDLSAPVGQREALMVSYERGSVSEQYFARDSAIEQRFVLREPLRLPSGHHGGVASNPGLVIAGRVDCAGRFESTPRGWRWSDEQGAVQLGNVSVYDSNGRSLLARMDVTAKATRIVVEGEDLAGAAYPVTIDPEIGTNDFRISEMGGTGDPGFIAFRPDVAYSSTLNNYFVVWHGDDNTGGFVDDETHIFGRYIDAASGDLIGDQILVSFDFADAEFDGINPAVAWSSTDDRYMVVWRQDVMVGNLIEGEFEIWARWFAAEPGLGEGLPRLVSSMGGQGDPAYYADFPDIAYNSTDDEYLVVWEGTDNEGGLKAGEPEIFGRRINPQGVVVDADDLRISDMGGTGDGTYVAASPSVAYNAVDNEYLVTWNGNDGTDGLADFEFEIFGQRLNAATGTAQGINDFRISDMGGTGSEDYFGAAPSVAHNPLDNEYMVVWHGVDNEGGLIDGEFEVFGQRLDALGTEVGENDFRVSDAGDTGNIDFAAIEPALVFNSVAGEYLVTWHGDDNAGGVFDDEIEIFGQRLNRSGEEIGANDFRLSDAGGNGQNPFFASFSALSWSSAVNQYLVVWHGTDDVGNLVDGEVEIFGQRWAAPEIFADGFESGDVSSWTSTQP